MPYPFVYNKYKRGSQPYSLGAEVVHKHNSPASAFAAFSVRGTLGTGKRGNECLKQAITACFYLTSSVLHSNTAVCTAVSGLCFQIFLSSWDHQRTPGNSVGSMRVPFAARKGQLQEAAASSKLQQILTRSVSCSQLSRYYLFSRYQREAQSSKVCAEGSQKILYMCLCSHSDLTQGTIPTGATSPGILFDD